MLGNESEAQAPLSDKGDFSWTAGDIEAPASETQTPTLTVKSDFEADITADANDGSGVLSHWKLSIASPTTLNSWLLLQNGGAIDESSTMTAGDNPEGGPDIANGGNAGSLTLTGKGVLTKTADSGSASINVPVHLDANDGDVLLDGGTLNLGDGGSSGSIAMRLTILPGAALALNGVSLSAGTTGSGLGTVAIENGTTKVASSLDLALALQVCSGEAQLANSSLLTVDGLTLCGGNLGDTSHQQGSLLDKGDFFWTAGDIEAPTSEATMPTLTVASGYKANITADANDGYGVLNHWNLSIASPTTLNSWLLLQNGGAIDESSTMTAGDNPEGGPDIANGGNAGSLTLSSKGVLTKAADNGTATIGVAVVNKGTIDAPEGNLSLSSLKNAARLNLTTGLVSISGDYSSSNAPVIALKVTSATHGELTVGDDASITGTLKIKTKSNYLPAIGSSITVLSAGGSSGVFSKVDGSQLDGEHWTPSYSGSGVELEAVPG